MSSIFCPSLSILATASSLCCDLIASNNVTALIRPNRPSLRPPFKVLLCKPGEYVPAHNRSRNSAARVPALVVGEFLCTETRFHSKSCFESDEAMAAAVSETLLSVSEARACIGRPRSFYTWHFHAFTSYTEPYPVTRLLHCLHEGMAVHVVPLDKAPASWCYVGN